MEPEIHASGLVELAEAADIDLLVTRSLPEIAEVRKRRPLAVLWVGDEARGSGPIENILCLAVGERARRAVGRFLRDHVPSGPRVTALVHRLSSDIASAL